MSLLDGAIGAGAMATLPLTILWVAATACKPGDTETDAQLPPADTGEVPRDTSPTEFPVDTSLDSGFLIEPEHTVTVHEWGTWRMSPSGGPYNALTGELRIREYLDGVRPDTADTGGDTDEVVLDCDVTYSLVGAPPTDDSDCAACDWTFEIEVYLVDGDPSLCHDPDRLQPDQVYTFGFSASDGMIHYDYGDIGLWLPWWPATRRGDVIEFEWEATLGIALEDTGEEQ